MVEALTDDVQGVMASLLDLYGPARFDQAASPTVTALSAETEGFRGPLATAYSGARGMHVAVADAHASKDAVVQQAIASSGGTVTGGRNSLTHQIADLHSRIQAISTIGDSRFSGPALLDAARTAIEKAAKQVNSDASAARKLATQIMPPQVPVSIVKRGSTPNRRTRPRRRRRTRLPSDATVGSNAVHAAAGRLGTPYVWGGGGAGGPSGGGFDCSGLTQYAIAQASDGQVTLPRTTYDQINSGVRIPVQDVRPGDLVFPASSFSRRGPEHVQLAAGNGMVIEAPYSGSTVKWSRMPSQAVVVRVL